MEILTKRILRSLTMIMAEIAKKEQKLFKVNKSGHAADRTGSVNAARADPNKIIN